MTQSPIGPAAFESGESRTDASVASADEAVGEDAVGDEAVGEDADGDEAVGDEAVGEDADGDEAIGEEAVADEAVAEDAVADDAIGDEAVREEAIGDEAAPARAAAPGNRPSRRLPGGRVVLVATLVTVTVAMLEVLERERIGQWTGITLVIVSALAVLVTRPGDRSLPAMMPPLAFLTAVVIAGQQLLSPSIDDTRQREAVMIAETLGENAVWVVAATAVAVLIALIGHLVTRRARRRDADAGPEPDVADAGPQPDAVDAGPESNQA